MHLALALLAGLLFGAGLTVAGMVDPQKILNFLDVAAIPSGGWDPTLLFVFAGALPVMFIAYRLQGASPWLGGTFQIPKSGAVDRPLAAGSALFGVGWGLAGFCPGPAVAGLALASKATLGPMVLFMGAMLLGVWLAIVARPLWHGSEAQVAV